MYIKETCEINGIKEIEKYTPWRSFYPKGEKRAAKLKPTSEAQKKVNERRAKKEKQRIIRANFEKGDLWVTFTYREEERPTTLEAAKADRKKLLDGIRRALTRQKTAFKYVCVTEIGSRGGVHHHMILKACDGSILSEMWKHGGIHIEYIYSEDLKKLARYMSGDEEPEDKKKHEVIFENWSRSRNLIVPEVKKERIHNRSFSKNPKPEKGYIIENLRNGINSWGYEWQSYELVPIEVPHEKTGCGIGLDTGIKLRNGKGRKNGELMCEVQKEFNQHQEVHEVKRLCKAQKNKGRPKTHKTGSGAVHKKH